jgi:hypothetical protein
MKKLKSLKTFKKFELGKSQLVNIVGGDKSTNLSPIGYTGTFSCPDSTVDNDNGTVK